MDVWFVVCLLSVVDSVCVLISCAFCLCVVCCLLFIFLGVVCGVLSIVVLSFLHVVVYGVLCIMRCVFVVC